MANMATHNMTGKCLCGAVTINVSGACETEVGACHCRMCQRWSGGLFLNFDASPSAVSYDGPVRRFASSPFSERAFCGTCGSPLWMRDTTSPDDIFGLMPGLFDEARHWPLRSEIYIDQALSCVSLAGDHNRLTAAEYESQHPHVQGD